MKDSKTTVYMESTMELKIVGVVEPGSPAITNAPMEHCRPEEPSTIKDFEVWLLNSDGNEIQRLDDLEPEFLSICTEMLFEQAEQDEKEQSDLDERA